MYRYGLVAFEMMIVSTSIWALARASAKDGSAAVSPRVEAFMHAGCVTVGLVAFAVFYMFCAGINEAGYNR
jgi:hypothetical protein